MFTPLVGAFGMAPFALEISVIHAAVCADLCASGATQSVPCPADSDCPPLPTGASCTALAGML